MAPRNDGPATSRASSATRFLMGRERGHFAAPSQRNTAQGDIASRRQNLVPCAAGIWQGRAMKRLFAVLVLIALAGVSPTLRAVENAPEKITAAKPAAGNFITVEAIDWKSQLPPPPSV